MDLMLSRPEEGRRKEWWGREKEREKEKHKDKRQAQLLATV